MSPSKKASRVTLDVTTVSKPAAAKAVRKASPGAGVRAPTRKGKASPVTATPAARSIPGHTAASKKIVAAVRAPATQSKRVPVRLQDGRLVVGKIEIDAPTRIIFYFDGENTKAATFLPQLGNEKGFAFQDVPPSGVFGAAGSYLGGKEVRLTDQHTQKGQWRFQLNATMASSQGTLPTRLARTGGPIIINR